MEPEARWDVWDPPAVTLLAGPESVLCEDPPEDMPVSRRAGFVLD